jgi:hypothetical protein
MVVAGIALFLAMGGVSYGLATGSIDSREIKNNTVRGRDVRNGTLTGNDVRPNGIAGGSINEARLGTVPFAEALSHSAVVSGGGQLIRGRGVTSAARSGEGRFQVLFNRDVRGCVYVASVGGTSAAAPSTGQALTYSLASNVNGVAVRTTSSAGALSDRSFHLLVSC